MKLPWMLRLALVPAAALLLLHLLGGRQAVGVLSGTEAGDAGALVLGLAYALSWFCTVLLVPPLVLTGLLGLLPPRRRRAPP
jgi:hypothetical protein